MLQIIHSAYKGTKSCVKYKRKTKFFSIFAIEPLFFAAYPTPRFALPLPLEGRGVEVTPCIPEICGWLSLPSLLPFPGYAEGQLPFLPSHFQDMRKAGSPFSPPIP